MKQYRLHLDLTWEIIAESEEDALDRLSEQIALNNETVENIFWEGIECIEQEEVDDEMET